MCISIYYIYIYIYCIHMIVCIDASLYKRPRHPLKWVQGPGPSGPRFDQSSTSMFWEILTLWYKRSQKTNWKDPPCYFHGKIHYFDWAIFAMSGHNQRLEKVSQVRLVNIKWWPSLDWGICHVETNPWCYFPFLGKPRPNFLLHPENLKKKSFMKTLNKSFLGKPRPNFFLNL